MDSPNKHEKLASVLGAYFPPCKVAGNTSPSVSQHFAITFLQPAKCATCRFSHEGECIRRSEGRTPPWSFEESLSIFQPMRFDFGPCGVPDVDDIAAVRHAKWGVCWVPAKCANCKFLREDLQCNRYWNEHRLPCSLDFGQMTEERALALLAEKLGVPTLVQQPLATE
jgi:hypothetical protein